MEQFQDAPPYHWKTVRVFISSTFRDFHAERDYLVKYVFPELREWCHLSKLHLVDIDLRWGVTREEAENGKVLDICLEHIDDSRPFFICMLGNRYGWVPKIGEVSENIKKKHHSFDIKTRCSITHLEILHAVLDPLEFSDENVSIPHAYFYFRDENSLPSLEDLSEFSDGERAEYQKAFIEKDQDLYSKLAELKIKIKDYIKNIGIKSGNQKELEDRLFTYSPVFDSKALNPEDDKLHGRFTKESLKAFGERVKADLKKAFELQFQERIDYLSKKHKENLLETELDYHEAFVENRTRLFIGREKLLHELYDYVDNDSKKILAIYGEPGSGKSALLAQFYNKIKESKLLIIPHFIGASPGSTSLHRFLMRMCEELKKKFNITDEIPIETIKLPLAFHDFLDKATESIVIIVDGLNQFDEANNAHDLSWLPFKLNQNIKIIVSTLGGETWNSLQKRTDSILNVTPLTDYEQQKIIKKMPSVFCKTLDKEHIKTLLTKKATRNPLYLKVVLNELRVFGSFEKLGDTIVKLPETVIGIFSRLLTRLEEEHGRTIVQRLFCLIECSRHGLNVKELKEMIVNDNELSHVVILRQIREYLHNRGNLIDFFHRDLSKAIRKRYLAEASGIPDRTIKWHGILAEYFMTKPIFHDKKNKVPYSRKSVEQPWQQIKAEMWDELEDTLCDLFFIEAKCQAKMVFDLVTDYQTALNCEKFKGRRRKRSAEFGRFVQAQSHVFLKHPQSVYQQAFNQPSSSLLFKTVRKLSSENKLIAPWFNWKNKPQTQDPCLLTIFGHPNPINGCLFTPDNKRILSCSNDNTLKLWNAETGCEIFTMRGHEDWVVGFAISPDGHRIASCSLDGTLKVWDTESGKEINTLKGHSFWIESCVFSPDNYHLFSVAGDNTLKIWDTRSGYEISTWEKHSWIINPHAHERKISMHRDSLLRLRRFTDLRKTNQVLSNNIAPEKKTIELSFCTFSPDGRYLLISSDDNFFDLWEIGNKNKIVFRNADMHLINSCAFSPDGCQIITGGYDAKLLLWDIEKGTKIGSMVGHENAIDSCGFSSDGRRIVSGSLDGTLKIWDVETCLELSTLYGHNSSILSCTFSQGDQQIVSGSSDGTLKIWDADYVGVNVTPKAHSMIVRFCKFSPDARHIVSIDTINLKIWDIESNNEEFSATEDGGELIDSCEFSPDGRHIVTDDIGGFIVIWDTESCAEIAYMDCDRTWEIESGGDFSDMGFRHSFRYPQNFAFFPDRSFVVLDRSNSKLKFCDVSTGTVLTTLESKIINGVCDVSPDGQCIIALTTDGLLVVWHIISGVVVNILEGLARGIRSCHYSPDGRLIVASVDNKLKLWNARSGLLIATLEGHLSSVTSFIFSQDSCFIISSSEDKTIRIWNVANCLEVSLFCGNNQFDSVDIDSSGQIIAGDNEGRIYHLSVNSIQFGSPIATPVRLFNVSSKLFIFKTKEWSKVINVFCRWCGKYFIPETRIINRIQDLNKHLSPDQTPCLNLPNDAWNNPLLHSECSNCKQPLRVNPFIVDNKEIL